MMAKATLQKNLHLGLSAAIVIIAAMIYGLHPKSSLPYFLDFTPDSLDQMSIFRALMGLYFGMASLWILGMVKSTYWKAATLLNVVFMGGIALGRILSWILDGAISNEFLLGLIGELVLMGWGIVNLCFMKPHN